MCSGNIAIAEGETSWVPAFITVITKATMNMMTVQVMTMVIAMMITSIAKNVERTKKKDVRDILKDL